MVRTASKTCSVEECDKRGYSKGMCAMHYARLRRTGTTDARERTGHGHTRYRYGCRCEVCRAARAAWLKRYQIKKLYGIEWEDYLKMCEDGCALCGSHERLCVDHDHVTGATRSILCAECNSGIGMFNDDPDMLLRAAEYLQEHRG